MSYCIDEGKDKVTFLTKEDYEKPADKPPVLLDDEEEDEEPGLILPSGEINWNCPCLGGMASGPCGVDFREAFSCFHYSKEEPKGSDCFEAFQKMQDCMVSYPELYPMKDDDDDSIDQKLSELAEESEKIDSEGARDNKRDVAKKS